MLPISGFNPYQNPFATNSMDKSQADKMLLDWKQRQQLMDRQTQDVAAVAHGAVPGNIGQASHDQVAQSNYAQQLKDAAGVTDGPYQGGGVVPASSLVDGSPPPNPMAAVNGAGKISDNYTPKPGMYYSSVTPDNILSLIQDPSQAMGYWAKFHGYNDAYANRLSSVFNINDLLRAMGIGGAQMAGTNELDWQGRLADRLSGRLKDASGGGYDYLNPQSIAASIFSTPRAGLDSGANNLAISINNPNLQPEEQITNVAQFVLGSLQGVLTNDQLNAYSQVLDQLATQFMRQYQTTPGGGAADRPTFLEYVRQNGGQYGGLF
jgi:hypothetical protein